MKKLALVITWPIGLPCMVAGFVFGLATMAFGAGMHYAGALAEWMVSE